MTPEEKALRDLWMSEMWATVHEASWPVPAAKRKRSTEREDSVDKADRKAS